jgi:hypothetical protein
VAAFVQSVSTSTSTGVSSLGVAMTTQNMTPGSTVVAAVFTNTAGGTLTFSSVSDPTNGNYTPVGTMLTGASSLSGYASQMFYLPVNASAAKPTVTLMMSGSSSFLGIAIHEYTGGVSTLEQYAYVNQNASSPAQTVTPNSSTDLIFAYDVPGTTTTGIASPFTERESANWAANGTADDTSPTGGSAATATWTISSPPADNMLGIAVFSLPAGYLPPFAPAFVEMRPQTPLRAGRIT